MKKLGKLSISPEKIIKNDELINLKLGSYGAGECCGCGCHYYNSGGSTAFNNGNANFLEGYYSPGGK